MYEVPLIKKIILSALIISILVMLGGIMAGARELLQPMATIFAGGLIALALLETLQR